MTDFEIVSLYWQRSEKAISCSMQKYGLYLLKLATNILHIHEEAEECVNDTCMSAWNQLPPDRPDKLLPYLGRIARCLALNRYDYLNAQKRSTNLTLQLSELEDCLSASISTEQEYESTALAETISTFLWKQSEDDRNMFIRRYWYSDSIRQIAERYGLRESKVKSQLFRVRNRLKDYLKKEGYVI